MRNLAATETNHRSSEIPSAPQYGFLTDATICIGCKACEVACKQWNQLPADSAADGFTLTGFSYDNTIDLGATTCLARVPRCHACPLAEPCPSRGSRYEPLRKQSRFEGSFRQRRAALLRLVAEQPRPVGALDPEAFESLVRDGLVEQAGELVRLPA